MASLGVNIDHIANVRQARRALEPDPVTYALLAELGGADGITVHLREDRRHIQDRDVDLLRATLRSRLNLEMAATAEMEAIALRVKPDMVTLVPEKRQEVTTEGGLDVAGQLGALTGLVGRLQDAGIPVSLFVDAERGQLEACQRSGARWVELHTGSYSEASWSQQPQELARLSEGSFIARSMGLPIKRLVLATNENNVLDEFFRTGKYRVRKSAEVHATSSPSMDISKASNFERYVCDILRRDTGRMKALWAQLDSTGAFDLSGDGFKDLIAATGFSSGTSTHADRLATIRAVSKDYGVVVDTHTADGIKVGLEHREAGVPLICLETAQPAKFAETIREALGRDPERPAGFEAIEKLPQRFEVIDADATKVKDYIAART